MEHFAIIQAICRGALANPSNAMRKQVERLIEALIADGEEKQVVSLRALLNSAERNKEIAPSRLTLSRGAFAGEVLTPNVPLPVDKETSAQLAQIIFPNDIASEAPIFIEPVKTAIESVINEWRQIDQLKEIGVEPARSCLIYGAPGTGKTRLALWIAKSLGVPVVLTRLDGLMSSFLGTTSRNIGNLFAFVNRYQCVLLLDEFDAIAKLRDDPQEVGEIKRVVNTLLQNLDSRKDTGFTLGLTNHPNLLDPAIWRRFEIQLEIPKPDFRARLEIVRSFMPPLTPPESHIRLLAWATDNTSGAEIEMLVRSYKKATIIGSADSPQDLLTTLKHFATLNAARIAEPKKSLLFADLGTLFKAIKNDETLNFSLADIGEVAGKDKSTVSRHLGKQTT
jgi:SpoVK/Ycf46/Vps4 family AAA+-type ATPase